VNEKRIESVLQAGGEKMQELIKRCIGNDREAMGKLYEAYRNQVYKTAYLLTRNAALSDDITQEAFLRIFSKLSLYKAEYSFDSWLYKVVLNVYRNMTRKERFLTFFPLFRESEEADKEEGPLRNLERNEQKDVISDIVKTLPNKLREVIILKYFVQLSQEDIAEVLQIPLGTVKSRIHTGLGRIRNQIEADASIKEVLTI
jgi:RNA polymerase sigma-70 factor (ECF subfamily)